MRVICIDDDVGELETLSSALDSMAEFDVESYSSPTAALARIREAPPAIIFSDLKMPRISGLELLSFVRNDPLLTSIPFVIVTQIDIKYVLQASFAAQADDVITKPYDEWEIRARAMALLRRARRQYRHDAFLSYARRDAKLADALVVGLREVGLSVWYDRDLPSGADWQSEIRSNLLDSANVVALWTSTSVKSPQVLQ